MRAFIAIELPQNIKQLISRFQSALEPCQADVKWVSSPNIHLTLKFLGEIDDKTGEAVIETIKTVCTKVSTFIIKTGRLGAFPSLRSPRVIWLGLSAGDEECVSLAEQIESGLSRAGIPKEDREFSSHITIGRVRSQKNLRPLQDKLAKLEEKEELQEGFEVRKVTLFKSTLTPQGPVYEKIYETALRTT